MPTTNNNWPTPVATDLVKDGWEAIKDLGDAIDTTLGVYAPPATGLTLINTTSFSAVASQSVNNVFSATYANYAIQFTMTQNTTAGNVGFRYRVGGVDDSSANHFYAITGLNAGAAADNLVGNAQTTQLFNKVVATTQAGSFFNFYNPAVALLKSFNVISNGTSANSSTGSWVGGGLFNGTTIFDGITFITSAGTMTGTIRVYGYNN